jgi:glycosyltransferase involved in cell wall biosynthesis
MSYYAFSIVRDGEKTIGETINSVVNQTIPPRKFIVVNDGSTDNTANIIDNYKSQHPSIIEVISTGSKTRDYTRLPSLRNLAVIYAREHGFDDCDYHMNTAGDCRYESAYAEKVLRFLKENPDVVIASGDYGSRAATSPWGAGRFVRQSFFKKYYEGYPEKVGWEDEMLARAKCNGYRIAVVKDAIFEHLDELGHSHKFNDWGKQMKAVGYSHLHVFGRCAKMLFSSNEVRKMDVLKILWSYLTYRPQESGYYSQYDRELRKAVAKMQRHEIFRRLKRRLGF